jgi:MFS family permease
MVGVALCVVAVSLNHSGAISDIGMYIMIVFGSIFQSYLYASSTRLRLLVGEFSTPEFMPKAVAIVIFGGVFGSLIGPLLGRYTTDMLSAKYMGAYIQVLCMYGLYFFTVQFVDFAKNKERLPKAANASSADSDADKDTLSIKDIFRHPQYAAILYFSVTTYTVMAVYMTGFGLAMKDSNLTTADANLAITAHQLSMFLPSLLTGSLVKRLGVYESSALGFVILLLGAGIFWINSSLALFITGICLIGLGWNVTFVAVSSRLVTLFGNQTDRKRAEGLHDTIMLSFLGLNVIVTGTIYSALDWKYFNLLFFALTIPALLLSIYMAIWDRSGAFRARRASVSNSVSKTVSAEEGRLEQV